MWRQSGGRWRKINQAGDEESGMHAENTGPE